ncbi:MAG: tetratricopeptide repeat protein [Myxococcota bacterium]
MIGPYRLMELRERGATTEVHLAWDTRLNQRVELTRMPLLRRADDEETWRRFLEVMRRLTGLQHPSLQVPTGFASPSADAAWFVTDHADGERLRDLMERTGRLPWRVMALLLHEVATPLAWAHGHGVAHGRLAPERVIVEPTGRVTLGPLDVAARVLLGAGAGPDDAAALYDDVPYVAPEALAGGAPTMKGDLFSLGAMAWEMVTGRRLFGSSEDVRRHARAQRMAPDPGELVEGLPLHLRRLIQALLAVDPELRPTDARFVRDKLTEVLRGAGLNDPRASLREWLEREGRAEGRPRSETRPGFKGPAARTGDRRREVTGPGTSPPTEPYMAAVGASEVDETPAEEGVASGADLWTEPAARHEIPERSTLRVAALLALLVVALGVGLWIVFRQGDEGGGAAGRSARVEGATAPAPATTKVSRQLPPEADVEAVGAPPRDRAEAFTRKAESLLEAGNASLAEDMAREGLEQGGEDDSGLKLSLGRALAEQGRVDAAVEALLAADEEEVGATRGHVEAGFALAQAGRCEDALPIFDEAARRGLDSAELHKLTGNCHLLVGDPEEAIASLEVAEAKTQGDLDVLVPLATALEQAGRLEEARGYLERALEVAPEARRVHVALARIEAKTGQGGRAVARLDGTEDPDAPADPDALEVRAHAAFEAGRYGAAAKAYRRAIEAAGEDADPDLVRNYAVAMDRAGYTRAAIDAYRDAVDRIPDDPELSHRLGVLLAEEGRHRAAIRALEDALRADPGRWKARFRKGLSELESGQPEDAARTFGEVVEQRPSDVAALQNLGKAQVDADRREAALETFGRLADLRPDDPSPVLTMAALAQRMERTEEASRLLREACNRGAREACE